MTPVLYGKTPAGQLLYDLAFTDLQPRYLARKHRLPIKQIRRLRSLTAIVDLRQIVAADRKRGDLPKLRSRK